MENIKNAMKVIQEFCEKHEYCQDCIFYDTDDDICRFCVDGPFSWNLNSEALK